MLGQEIVHFVLPDPAVLSGVIKLHLPVVGLGQAEPIDTELSGSLSLY